MLNSPFHRGTPFGYAAEELWAPSSCSGLSLSSRSCSALLRPDASYEARAAVGCLDGRALDAAICLCLYVYGHSLSRMRSHNW